MRNIRSYREVANPAGEDIIAQVTEQVDRLHHRLAAVRRIVVIASGKGGVGKSALTANLAVALGARGLRVGVLDADLNGPSLGRMLGVSGRTLPIIDGLVEPVTGPESVRVVTTDLLLPSEGPLRWKSPVDGKAAGPAFLFQSMYEGSVLRELLSDVNWGQLDFLLIDAPPGTDKLDRILQLLPSPPMLLLVTTPSEVTRQVVARSIVAARDLPTSQTALLLNMDGHVCQHCGEVTPLFDPVDADELGREHGLEVWASLPFEPALARATDHGQPFAPGARDSAAARAIEQLAARIVAEAS